MSSDNLNDPPTPHVFVPHVTDQHVTDEIEPNPNFENGDFAPLDSSTNTQIDLDACWEKVSARMRVDLGDAAWRSWIKPLRVGALQNNMLIIEA
ncbi:MAG: chromosomal replication initiator protein DnaA, partial [Candidatus Puniceispirillum sp.]|nr:chromosomal replication initiator protein DnaA [Candidatus Puniceispirillum sp.]